jgi:DNA-binding response OmpR family regulator
MEAMGGTLGAESRLGAGSTFSLTLTEADAWLEREELDAPPAPALGTDAGQRSATVLYVEDNASNLKLVERVLAQRPEVRLMTAMQGGLGLELAREHRPDLILLDLHLPDVPGKEVLALLRHNAATATVPVIVLSANATPGQVSRLLASGADAYLAKPLDVERFLGLVDSHLEPAGERE